MNSKPTTAKNNKASKVKGSSKKLMLVRYGQMGTLGWFEHNLGRISKLHSKVVIQTDRGLELGDVVGPWCYRAGQFRQSCEQVKDYYSRSGAEQSFGTGGTFVRYATTQDISEEKHLQKNAQQELECCRRFVKELELPMKLVGAEHVFGGERIIFYFTSDGRVDFRELVKKLAHEYQTRIEMRQIGSRDEAKLVADYEICGQLCCCRNFLKILKPVSMRMAKLQKATLDPSKISGHCGRLRCCLRYEDDTYQQLKERLPKRNTQVKTAYGEGKVVNTQILTQLVVVRSDDGKEFAVPVEEIELINAAPANNGDKRGDDSDMGKADKNGNDSMGD